MVHLILFLLPLLILFPSPSSCASQSCLPFTQSNPYCIHLIGPVKGTSPAEGICLVINTGSAIFTIDSPKLKIFLGDDPMGLYSPYFDETGTLTVINTATGESHGAFYRRWQATCQETTIYPNYNDTQLPGFQTTTLDIPPAVDITNFFQGPGTYLITLVVSNAFGPAGTSDAYVCSYIP